MKKIQKKPVTSLLISKRFFFLSVLLLSLLLLASGVATTYALLKESDKKSNDFAIGDFKTSLVEEFVPPVTTKIGAKTRKKVAVKNTGETFGFVRVLVLPQVLTKKDVKNEQLLLPATIGNEVFLLDGGGNKISDNADWQIGNDGYYYYLKPLTPNEQTATLFEQVQLSTDVLNYYGDYYLDAELTVDIKIEGISGTRWAYRDAWWNGNIPTVEPLLSINNQLKKFAREEE